MYDASCLMNPEIKRLKQHAEQQNKFNDMGMLRYDWGNTQENAVLGEE